MFSVDDDVLPLISSSLMQNSVKLERLTLTLQR